MSAAGPDCNIHGCASVRDFQNALVRRFPKVKSFARHFRNFFVTLQQPFVAGLERFHSLWVYTSRGTGCWGLPSRFLAPSEITRLRLVHTTKPLLSEARTQTLRICRQVTTPALRAFHRCGTPNARGSCTQ